MAAIDRRVHSPYSNVARFGDWQVVNSATQRPGSWEPNRAYEWIASNDRVAALVVVEIHKYYVDLPKALAFVDTVDKIVRSIRSEKGLASSAATVHLAPAK